MELVFDASIPSGQRQPAYLAYPAHHTYIKTALSKELKPLGDKTVWAETRLHSALARTAARQGIHKLSPTQTRDLFEPIREEEACSYSLDRHWGDMKDAVSYSLPHWPFLTSCKGHFYVVDAWSRCFHCVW